MHFLSPSQQCQSTEGKVYHSFRIIILLVNLIFFKLLWSSFGLLLFTRSEWSADIELLAVDLSVMLAGTHSLANKTVVQLRSKSTTGNGFLLGVYILDFWTRVRSISRFSCFMLHKWFQAYLKRASHHITFFVKYSSSTVTLKIKSYGKWWHYVYSVSAAVLLVCCS